MKMSVTEPIAILSDINANLEALSAVLEDIKHSGVEQILFLGDSLGYGANPIECFDLIKSNCSNYLMGRIERSLMKAEDSMILHTLRKQLKEHIVPCPENEIAFSRWDWLKRRPFKLHSDKFDAVHTNPISDTKEGLSLDTLKNKEVLTKEVTKSFSKLIFIGDNHQQWYWSPNDNYGSAKEVDRILDTNQFKKVVVSVGSVGQPRDFDPRAAYVIFKDNTVYWRRVKYDVETASKKIFASPLVPDSLGLRLLKGI